MDNVFNSHCDCCVSPSFASVSNTILELILRLAAFFAVESFLCMKSRAFRVVWKHHPQSESLIKKFTCERSLVNLFELKHSTGINFLSNPR